MSEVLNALSAVPLVSIALVALLGFRSAMSPDSNL